MGRVLDAQVAWVGAPDVVLDDTRFPGAARVEEVDVWLDHVGDFDGEHRTFQDVTVRRTWRLQRINRGPWRVAESQPI
jgi:hypothetical protein